MALFYAKEICSVYMLVPGPALPSPHRREGLKHSKPHAQWRTLKSDTRQQIRSSGGDLKRAVALFASAIMLGTAVRIFEEIERRLALPENRKKWGLLTFETGADQLCVRIKDGGNGFDWQPYLEISQ
jgi:hypothetical protein